MKREEHPKDKANFVSKITLWWIFELLWKGNSRPLEQEDLYSVRDEDSAKYLTKRLEKKWENEKNCAKKSKRKPHLWKALLNFFTWRDYGILVLTMLMSNIGQNITWISTIKFLDLFWSNRFRGVISYIPLLVCVFSVIMGGLVRALSLNYFHLQGTLLGIRARAAVVGLLYKKVMYVSKSSIETGHVMELICNDSQRLVTSGEWFIQDGIRKLTNYVFIIALLFYYVGWAFIPALILFIFLGVYLFVIVKLNYKLRRNASQFADERLGYLREFLMASNSIRMNCLEEIFEEKLRQTRWKEIKIKAKRWFFMSMGYSLHSTGPQLGTFITIFVLVFADNLKLSYQTVFYIMLLITELSSVVCHTLPTIIPLVTNVVASLQRMQNFLENSHQLLTLCQESLNNHKEFDSAFHHEKGFSRIPYLNFFDVTCKLPSPLITSLAPTFNNVTLLNYITFHVSQRGLILITGPVGSGKSSLLACVLDGELLITNGTVKYSGNLAYVSDTPWVFPGTIRENILFGLPYNEEWYLQTVKACQLENDFMVLPQGDLSRIGEHGATVSGGQRTRIALARAVYSKADIYLLDDPLSSLDATVSENIFKNCLRGLLGDRIVLLTTRTTRYLKEADYIVKLKGGVIVAQGNFNEIKEEFSEIECGADKPSVSSAEGHLGIDQKNACEEMVPSEKMGEILREAKEDREIGSVSRHVYWEYFVNGASPLILLLVASVYLVGQGMTVVVNLQVSRLPKLFEQEGFHQAIVTYTVMLVVTIFLTVFGTLCVLFVLINAAYVMHNKMVSCLIKAPGSFYVTNPTGRILNRFSQDIDNLDEQLPYYSLIFGQHFLPLLATFVLSCIANVVLIPFVVAAILTSYFIGRFYLHTAMDLKRLMSIAAGPLYSHFSNTMEGVITIRVHNRQKMFTDEVYRFIDNHDQGLFAYYTSVRWFSNVLEMLGVVYVVIVSITVILLITYSSNAVFGAVSFLYAVTTSDYTQYCARLFTEIHSQMTSAERTLAYTKINAEKGRDINKDPPENWPHSGAIQFKNVSLWHYEDGPKVLKNLNFNISSMEKIGIAGRTGAGKSSLVAALMRLAETDGEIIVDDIDIMKLNVMCTRRNISTISQSPILISSSIRENLDPSAKFTDSEIWHALHQMQIKSVISELPQQLDSLIIGTSSGFSIGERQLLHLARVSLKKSKIIIFDEVTAKVDEKTNEIIQRIIRDVFKDCTVVTVAHQLSTILDCDRIMVLDRGEIVEFDSPEVLLGKKDGTLRQLYKI